MNYPLVPLASVVSLQRGIDLPGPTRRPGPYPVVSAGGVVGSHDEAPVKGPGVAIGRATNLGQPTWVEGDYWPLNTTLFVRDFKGNDPRFVYRLFQSIDLTGFDSGSVQAMLNRNYIAQVPVQLPPLHTQRAIAEVLGALDDKIAANTGIATNADALVRAMFLAFGASEESRPLGDLATNPRVAARPPFEAGHYVGLEHVPRRLMWLTQTGDPEGLASGKFEFARGDVLFGKLRPYFHKVVVADRAGVCSTDILVVRSKMASLRGYVWAAAASDEVVARVSAMSEGTRMPRTNWSALASSEVPWPGLETAEAFSDRVVAIRDRVAAAIAESVALTNLRDTLLPHLMSGRITVREAEKQVEEVL